MSAECWFPLLQQLQMNWIEPQQPPEMWAGMWLVVPRSYEQGRENLFFQVILAPDSKSFEVNWGLWIRPLYKQPLFPDKGKKNLIFFGTEDLGVFFFCLKEEENLQRHVFVFPWRLCSWLETTSPVFKPLSALSLFPPFWRQRRLAARCPLLPQEHHLPRGERYLPATDRDGAQH